MYWSDFASGATPITSSHIRLKRIRWPFALPPRYRRSSSCETMATPIESGDSWPGNAGLRIWRAASATLNSRPRTIRIPIVLKKPSLTMWRCALSDSPGRPLTSMLFDP